MTRLKQNKILHVCIIWIKSWNPGAPFTNIDLNRRIGKYLYAWSSVGCNYITKLQRCCRWSLGINKWFHPTLYWACDYLYMEGLKLINVRKGVPNKWQWSPLLRRQWSNLGKYGQILIESRNHNRGTDDKTTTKHRTTIPSTLYERCQTHCRLKGPQITSGNAAHHYSINVHHLIYSSTKNIKQFDTWHSKLQGCV